MTGMDDLREPGFCVVMAGGRGTRFWPLSRTSRPKQLLPLLGPGRSLLRETCDRLLPLFGPERILVVTGVPIADAVRAELPDLPPASIIAEPVGRNTAPCAALGSEIAARLAGEGPVALLPADHWIPDGERFRAQLARACGRARASGRAVTFGVTPDRPETGYGYLEIAGGGAGAGGEVLDGVRFVEKPDRPTAERYLAGGRHLWNSGIFVWDSAVFRDALLAHQPAIAAALAPAVAAFGTPDFPAALADAYEHCPAISIDFGIMEQLPAFSVFRADFGWSDLGSWDAWGQMAPALPGGNRGEGQLFPVGGGGNVVHAPGKAVALVGVKDLIVVDTPDALLVCRQRDAQKIKDVIALLEKERRDLL